MAIVFAIDESDVANAYWRLMADDVDVIDENLFQHCGLFYSHPLRNRTSRFSVMSRHQSAQNATKDVLFLKQKLRRASAGSAMLSVKEDYCRYCSAGSSIFEGISQHMRAARYSSQMAQHHIYWIDYFA